MFKSSNNNSHHLYIPGEILTIKELCFLEQGIFSLLRGFALKENKITVSNRYLAEYFNTSIRNIIRKLNNLKRLGYLRSIEVRNKFNEIDREIIIAKWSAFNSLPCNDSNLDTTDPHDRLSPPHDRLAYNTQAYTGGASSPEPGYKATLNSSNSYSSNTVGPMEDKVRYQTKTIGSEEDFLTADEREFNDFILREDNTKHEPTFSFSLSQDNQKEEEKEEEFKKEFQEARLALEAQPAKEECQEGEDFLNLNIGQEEERASRFGTKDSDLSQTSATSSAGFIQADLDIINLGELINHGFMASDIREMLRAQPNPARLQESLDNFITDLKNKTWVKDKFIYFMGALHKYKFYNSPSLTAKPASIPPDTHTPIAPTPKERKEYNTEYSDYSEVRAANLGCLINPNRVAYPEAKEFKKSHPKGYKAAHQRWLKALENNLALKTKILGKDNPNRGVLDDVNYLNYFYEKHIWPEVLFYEKNNFEHENTQEISIAQRNANLVRMAEIIRNSYTNANGRNYTQFLHQCGRIIKN